MGGVSVIPCKMAVHLLLGIYVGLSHRNWGLLLLVDGLGQHKVRYSDLSWLAARFAHFSVERLVQALMVHQVA